MKKLLLMRHAKSSWDDDRLADYERPLNERGRRDAPRMGKLLLREGLVPDLIVSSSAERAAATARLVAAAASFSGDIRYEDALYLAEAGTYVERARRVDNQVDILMMIGHNPDIAELVALLSGRDEQMPTAALAYLSLPIEEWGEITLQGNYRLERVWRPKQLKE